jgi:hypothetical protein
VFRRKYRLTLGTKPFTRHHHGRPDGKMLDYASINIRQKGMGAPSRQQRGYMENKE